MNNNRLLKEAIKQFKSALCDEFIKQGSISTITRKLVSFIDKVLLDLFHQHNLHIDNRFCLLALGSYGRRELQLYSDIDLLLLHTDKMSKIGLQRAQAFVQSCWDIGLKISQQITTVNSCAELASNDITVISSILDMHIICGRGSLMEELAYQTHPSHMWTSPDFFFAKREEQERRYAKYGETAYNLEPNVKYGQGGLRDIQILLSIDKRHFGSKKLSSGIQRGFITDKEYEELLACQHFLWRVRFSLHLLADRAEERLLFDYQVKLAALFGFSDSQYSLAIEQFMKAYFKVIKRSRELNEMLLQWFSEAIVHQEKEQIIHLDDKFQLANNLIEVRNENLFVDHPEALLELFLWIVKRPDIAGVRASTIRLIRQNLYLISKSFRESPLVKQHFLALFKMGESPYEALHHMNRYEVLGHYLDSFAAVTGQMQYDLFHVYTVDQHTLFVIRNLTRFLKPDYKKQFSLAAQLMSKLKNPAILYLAALFHDIAKGRGGDHSELGAEDAQQFAINHQLHPSESKLLVWLVRYHLLMSQTAQRQDIYDPNTIKQFCALFPEDDYLDYLYLLTVADICATNHSLWNAWKDSLLKELHRAAHQYMQKKQELLDESTLIKLRKQQTLDILIGEGLLAEPVQTLWSKLNSRYFLHEPADVIARHTRAMLDCQQFPLVLIFPHHSLGGTEVMIYMPHRDERFTIATTVLSNNYTTIQEAVILTCENNFDLDTYIILDEQHQAFFSEERTRSIQQDLIKKLSDYSRLPTISRRRLSRIQAHFKLEPHISFEESNQNHHSSLFLVTTDRSGLLAQISRVFLSQGIHLHNAKIATAGERVEDMFFISNQTGCALNEVEREALRAGLIAELTKE